MACVCPPVGLTSQVFWGFDVLNVFFVFSLFVSLVFLFLMFCTAPSWSYLSVSESMLNICHEPSHILGISVVRDLSICKKFQNALHDSSLQISDLSMTLTLAKLHVVTR